MRSNETIAHLEQIAEMRPDFEASPMNARVQVGLEYLEMYTSNLVVAWLEDNPHDVLNALIKTDLFETVRDATTFVSQSIKWVGQPQFESLWHKYESFVLRLGKNGSKIPEVCFVGMFFSVVVLRAYFDLISEHKSDPERIVQLDETRFSPLFISLLMPKAKALPITFNIHGRVLQRVSELPDYLGKLMRWIG